MQLNQENKQTIFELMQAISAYLPMPVYWLDLDGVVQGANELGCQLFAAAGVKSVAGKTMFDLYPSQVADAIVKHNLEVMCTKEILSQEFALQGNDGMEVGFSAMKIPLLDKHGKLVGIVVSPNSAWQSDRKTYVQGEDKPYLTPPAGWSQSDGDALCVADSGLNRSAYYLSSPQDDTNPWELASETDSGQYKYPAY